MTLLEKAQCMLSNIGLSKYFWIEAVSIDYYLVNWSPSITIGFKSPEMEWSSILTNYYHL